VNVKSNDWLVSSIQIRWSLAENQIPTRYLDPTIVYPVTWADRIMEDEVFGPIVPILTYKTLDEALTKIAATPHHLQISSSVEIRTQLIDSLDSCHLVGAR
jgi:acyl-CoA reductase-like NAD-dependent aldehyde dehydrogenase